MEKFARVVDEGGYYKVVFGVIVVKSFSHQMAPDARPEAEELAEHINAAHEKAVQEALAEANEKRRKEWQEWSDLYQKDLGKLKAELKAAHAIGGKHD